MAAKGVYFLANDSVYDLSIAFLNSFRMYNPDIELCLIPFDDHYQKISQWQARYNFSVYHDIDILHACDEIGRYFFSKGDGAFRKLAAWEGEFDEFIYIDVDTLVFDSIDFAFNYLNQYSYIASHSNLPKLQAYVWQPSIHSSGMLTAEQISFSTNTGFFVSRKGFLSMAHAREKLLQQINIKQHLATFYKEQPFLNYLIVTSGKPYTSLLTLFLSGHGDEIGFEYWAGNKSPVWFSKKERVWKATGCKKIFLLHWAGEWQIRKLDRILWRLLRMSGLKKPEDSCWCLRILMPHKKLWNCYRYLNSANDKGVCHVKHIIWNRVNQDP